MLPRTLRFAAVPGLLALAAVQSACAPRYAAKGPMQPSEIWTPLPVQHIMVHGVDIAYLDSGDPPDAPPSGNGPSTIVLVHGLSSYSSFWEYQVPHLAKRHRVLALDLPGFGQSGRPDAPYTPPWYADVVSDWMAAVWASRAVVIGHSMGGQVAMTLALEHPERVERLVLSAPAGIERFSPGASQFMKSWWTETRAMEAGEDEIRANFVASVFNNHDAGVERLVQERVRLGHGPAFAATSVAVSRSIAGMLDFPVWSRLPEITVATLIVYGSDDHLIPNPVFNGGSTRSVGEQGAARLPDAQLVMLPGAGHTAHHDDPRGFNAAVDRFLGDAP